jgi:hypothetical protein
LTTPADVEDVGVVAGEEGEEVADAARGDLADAGG